MSSVRIRSKTGCLTCRNRRKKCDEIRPYCLRCRRAGMECLGYSHLDNSALRPRISGASTLSNQTGADCLYPREAPGETSYSNLELSNWTIPDFLLPSLSAGDIGVAPPSDVHENHNGNRSSTSYIGSNSGFDTLDTIPQIYTDFGDGSAGRLDLSLDTVLNSTELNNLMLPTSLQSGTSMLPQENDNILGEVGYPRSSTNLGYYQVASLNTFDANLSAMLSIDITSTAEHEDSFSVKSDDSDTEGVLDLIRPTLALDRNVVSNFLPFTLSVFLRWSIRTVFEPLKTVELKRDHLVQRYMKSEESRSGTVLIANILDMLMRDPSLAGGYFPQLAELEDSMHRKLAELSSWQDQAQDACTHNAQDALYDMHEVIHIRSLSTPLSFARNTLRKAVCAYQHACHGSSSESVSLTAKLVHPNALLRHFHALDVMLSLGTGYRTLLRYEITPLDEIYDKSPGFERLQWMYGLPDQFLTLLARMHALREDSGPITDIRTIREIELEISSFRPSFDHSGDSYLIVARIMVQESWRQALYIYLYMGLCNCDALDLRVKKALKAFIKLLRGVNAGRIPDRFLLIALIVAGVAAHQPFDRSLIQNRLLGLRECAQSSGGAGEDAVRILGEVWAISGTEARPSMWKDLGVAYSRVSGAT